MRSRPAVQVRPVHGGYSTAALAPQRRLDGWTHAVSDRFLECSMEVRDPESFDATFRNRDMHPVALSLFDSKGHGRKRVMRSAAQATRGAEEFYILGLQLQGLCVMEQDGRAAELSAGAFAIVDSRRAYQLALPGDYRMAVYRIARRDLERRLPHARELTGRTVEAASLAATQLLQLTHAWQGAPPLPAHAERDYADAVTALASAGMRGIDAADVSPADCALARAKAQLLRQMHEPHLALCEVAAALGMSQSSLHQLFQAEGSSPARWLWQQRLAACRDALADPRQAACSLTEIAFDHGFCDAAHFSRSFRRAFGQSPGAWRRDAGGSDAGEATAPPSGD